MAGKGGGRSMISYDFEYYRPKTYGEAIDLFKSKSDEGKNPVYYSGGTETVTYARNNTVKTGAVIDLKSIEETNVFSEDGDKIIYGSSLSLNHIIEKTSFKLMAHVLATIADHTVRNRISLGGNICGRLFYREAIIPLMASNATLVIAGSEGIRKENIMGGFDKRIALSPGEILLQIEIDKENINYPYMNIRKERSGKIDYPLFHIAALKVDDNIHYAFSGVCPFPFRSIEMENVLNDSSIDPEERVVQAIGLLPSNIIEDIHGSRDFRSYLLESNLLDIIKKMEGES